MYFLSRFLEEKNFCEFLETKLTSEDLEKIKLYYVDYLSVGYRLNDVNTLETLLTYMDEISKKLESRYCSDCLYLYVKSKNEKCYLNFKFTSKSDLIYRLFK